MSPPVFLDANIPIYAAGRPHPLKDSATRIVLMAAEHPEAFVTDVEVVQEMLHRYLALRLWDGGRAAVEQFMALMDGRIESVTEADLNEVVHLADRHRDVAARDLLHAAVMSRLGVTQIVSADADFDRIEGIERLDPAAFDAWRASIEA
jgi:predicted nucleic acid-binding protein